MAIKAVKLGFKKQRKKVLQLNKVEKKNPNEPNSAMIPCGEKLYFSFIFLELYTTAKKKKRNRIRKELETSLLKIPTNQGL